MDGWTVSVAPPKGNIPERITALNPLTWQISHQTETDYSTAFICVASVFCHTNWNDIQLHYVVLLPSIQTRAQCYISHLISASTLATT